MASFVFTEAVQREVHTQRNDRVNLRSAKAVHSSSQTRQVVIARDGRSGGACEDGANTRDEARRGRCCRQQLAAPGKGESNRRAHRCRVAACCACLSRAPSEKINRRAYRCGVDAAHVFPECVHELRTSLTPGFRIVTQRKDFVCESDKSQIWDFWDLWDVTVFSSRIRANDLFTGGSNCIS